MSAKPIFIRDTYKGSDKLKGKVAIITGGLAGPAVIYQLYTWGLRLMAYDSIGFAQSTEGNGGQHHRSGCAALFSRDQPCVGLQRCQ
jgi:hypothetical protein